MKLVRIESGISVIGDDERRTTQAVLDENRPFVIISKRSDKHWETSCWLPPSIRFYELLGALEMLKDNVKSLYLDDEEDE